jgi:hypothetical protein
MAERVATTSPLALLNWRRCEITGRQDVKHRKVRFNSTQIQPHNATGGL